MTKNKQNVIEIKQDFIEGPRIEASCSICRFSSIANAECRRLSPPFPKIIHTKDWCGNFSPPVNSHDAKIISIKMPGEQNKLQELINARET